MKLRKCWKIIFTIIIIVIGMIIYNNTKDIGSLAIKNNTDASYNIMSWIYIFFMQPFTILLIWL